LKYSRMIVVPADVEFPRPPLAERRFPVHRATRRTFRSPVGQRIELCARWSSGERFVTRPTSVAPIEFVETSLWKSPEERVLCVRQQGRSAAQQKPQGDPKSNRSISSLANHGGPHGRHHEGPGRLGFDRSSRKRWAGELSLVTITVPAPEKSALGANKAGASWKQGRGDQFPDRPPLCRRLLRSCAGKSANSSMWIDAPLR